MSASGHSKKGMFCLYQGQSRLSQKVWASRRRCLSRICAWAGIEGPSETSTTMRHKEDRNGGSELMTPLPHGRLTRRAAKQPHRYFARSFYDALGRVWRLGFRSGEWIRK